MIRRRATLALLPFALGACRAGSDPAPEIGPVYVTVRQEASVVVHDAAGAYVESAGRIAAGETVAVEVEAGAFVSAVLEAEYLAQVRTIASVQPGDAFTLLDEPRPPVGSETVRFTLAEPAAGAASYGAGFVGCGDPTEIREEDLEDLGDPPTFDVSLYSLEDCDDEVVPWVEARDAEGAALAFQLGEPLSVGEAAERGAEFGPDWRVDWRTVTVDMGEPIEGASLVELSGADDLGNAIYVRQLAFPGGVGLAIPFDGGRTGVGSWLELESGELTRALSVRASAPGTPASIGAPFTDGLPFAESLDASLGDSSVDVAWELHGLAADAVETFVYYGAPEPVGQVFWYVLAPRDAAFVELEWPHDWAMLRRIEGGVHGGALVDVRARQVAEASWNEIRQNAFDDRLDWTVAEWWAQLYWL